MATKEEIWAAAETLTEAGLKPTLANVREHLGSGSYTDISQHMQTWRARQQALATPLREPAPAAVTERLEGLAADLWAIALEIATGRLQAERDALEQARQDTELVRREAADLADQLAADLDRARADLQGQAEQLAALTGETITLRHQLRTQAEASVAAEHRAERAEAASAALQAQVAQLSALLEHEQAARSAAEDQARRAGETAAELRGRLAVLEAPARPASKT